MLRENFYSTYRVYKLQLKSGIYTHWYTCQNFGNFICFGVGINNKGDAVMYLLQHSEDMLNFLVVIYLVFLLKRIDIPKILKY